MYPFMTWELEGRGWTTSLSAGVLPAKICYRLYSKRIGPGGRSGRLRKTPPTLALNPGPASL